MSIIPKPNNVVTAEDISKRHSGPEIQYVYNYRQDEFSIWKPSRYYPRELLYIPLDYYTTYKSGKCLEGVTRLTDHDHDYSGHDSRISYISKGEYSNVYMFKTLRVCNNYVDGRKYNRLGDLMYYILYKSTRLLLERINTCVGFKCYLKFNFMIPAQEYVYETHGDRHMTFTHRPQSSFWHKDKKQIVVNDFGTQRTVFTSEYNDDCGEVNAVLFAITGMGAVEEVNMVLLSFMMNDASSELNKIFRDCGYETF